MTISRKEWKRKAKLALKGNYGILIMGMFLTTMANMAANSITNYFFPGTGIFTLILAEIFTFVISLVLNIFIAGYYYMNLRVARGEAAEIGDLLYFFRNGSDRVIIAGFVIALMQFLASIPLTVFNLTSVIGESSEELLQWEIHFLMLMLLTMALQTLLNIPFSMAYYLMADDPEMGGMTAIKKSMKMMKHHMGAYLLMQISFLPLILLSVLTFYLALIWILPYMNMVAAEFYRDLNGEFRNSEA